MNSNMHIAKHREKISEMYLLKRCDLKSNFKLRMGPRQWLVSEGCFTLIDTSGRRDRERRHEMKNDAMFGNIFVAKDFAILIQDLLNFLECYLGLKYVTSHLCIYLKENHN